MLILTADLEPTATYKVRSIAYVSNGSGVVTHDRTLPDGEVVTETIPALGKLTIKQQFRTRRTLKSGTAGRPMSCEVDTYAVVEVEPLVPGTRRFWLLNLTDADQREPYEVTIGGVNGCRCTAGLCRLPICKHKDSLRALIDMGAFDGPADFEAYTEPAPASAPKPREPWVIDRELPESPAAPLALPAPADTFEPYRDWTLEADAEPDDLGPDGLPAWCSGASSSQRAGEPF